MAAASSDASALIDLSVTTPKGELIIIPYDPSYAFVSPSMHIKRALHTTYPDEYPDLGNIVIARMGEPNHYFVANTVEPLAEVNENVNTMFMTALDAPNSVAALAEVMRAHPNPNVGSYYNPRTGGYTGLPLHTSAKRGDLRAFEFLMDHSANSDLHDYIGWSVAHHILSSNAQLQVKTDMMQILFDRNPNTGSDLGNLDMFFALRDGDAKLVEMLLIQTPLLANKKTLKTAFEQKVPKQIIDLFIQYNPSLVSRLDTFRSRSSAASPRVRPPSFGRKKKSQRMIKQSVKLSISVLILR